MLPVVRLQFGFVISRNDRPGVIAFFKLPKTGSVEKRKMKHTLTVKKIVITV